MQARYFFQQLVAGLEYCHSKVRHARLLGQTLQASVAGPAEAACCRCTMAAGMLHCYNAQGLAPAAVWLSRFGLAVSQQGADIMQGVCHRDLKLENVLLAGDHAPLVKICDFGYSKVRSVKCCAWLEFFLQGHVI